MSSSRLLRIPVWLVGIAAGAFLTALVLAPPPEISAAGPKDVEATATTTGNPGTTANPGGGGGRGSGGRGGRDPGPWAMECPYALPSDQPPPGAIGSRIVQGDLILRRERGGQCIVSPVPGVAITHTWLVWVVEASITEITEGAYASVVAHLEEPAVQFHAVAELVWNVDITRSHGSNEVRTASTSADYLVPVVQAQTVEVGS